MQLELATEDALSHHQLVLATILDHHGHEVETDGALKCIDLAIVTDSGHKLLEEGYEFVPVGELIVLGHQVDVPDKLQERQF